MSTTSGLAPVRFATAAGGGNRARSDNPEVVGSNPSPATILLQRFKVMNFHFWRCI